MFKHYLKIYFIFDLLNQNSPPNLHTTYINNIFILLRYLIFSKINEMQKPA